MYIAFRIIFCFAFVFFPFLSPSQSMLPATELTIKDGLSQGMIFDILQTSDGFMWFATKDGLNKYDGYNFTIFRHNPADSFSISDNTIIKLFEDDKQQLWVKTIKGLDVFDMKHQRFRHVLPAKAQKIKFNLDEYADIEQDKAGTLWLSCTLEGIYAIHLPEDLMEFKSQNANLSPFIKHELIPIQESEGRIYDILISSNQEIYVGTAQNCFQVLKEEMRVVPLNFPHLFDENCTKLMLEDEQKNILFLRKEHILRKKGDLIETILLPKNISEIDRFLIDKENHLWASGNSYLWTFNANTFSLQNPPENLILFLKNGHFSKIYCDKTGNIWLGTNGYGIRKVNPKQQHFHHLLEGVSTWALTKDKKENIFVKKYGGLYKVSPPNYVLDEKNPAQKIYDNIAFSVLLGDENDYWLLGSKDKLLEGIDNELIHYSSEWKKIKAYSMPFSFYQQTILIKDKKGNIWLNTTGSQLICFEPNTENSRVFDYGDLFNSSSANSLMMYFDNENTLWLGTNNGLIRAKEINGQYRFALFQNHPQDKFSLPNNVVSSFCDDPQNPNQFIWIGTKGGGLVQMDKKTAKCITYSEKQGLANAVVYGILPDEKNNLWISTNRGISKFNIQSKHFQPFTKDDGLQDDEFNTQAFIKSPQGELCFGGINGLNIFKPNEVIPNNIAPNTVIVGLKVNNTPITVGDSTGILPYALQTLAEISLSYQQNYLSLSFAALDFTTPDKNQFKYMLEGIDNDWVFCGNQTSANYTALEPGTYLFKVSGCNGDGLWAKTPASIRIVIRPPFWRSHAAYIFYVIVFIFLLYQLHKYQIYKIDMANRLVLENEEKQRLAALDEVKNRFYSNVTHEFRTPLTLILEPARQLLKELTDNNARQKATIIENNSQKLLQLVNQLLDLSKLESGSMKIEWQYGNLIEVIQPIYNAFDVLSRKKEVNLTWNYPQNFPFISFDKDKIEKILHNLLSNALKFTPRGGEIQLTTTIFQQNLQIIVKDTGIGIKPENISYIFQRFHQLDNALLRRGEGTGIGLSLVKELVELLEGNIVVTSEPHAGTTFSLQLPLKQKDFPILDTPSNNNSSSLFSLSTEIPFVLEDEIENAAENGKIILLIEDNDDMRTFISCSLQCKNYKVIQAENGQIGIEKAFELIPDLIISDVMMPEKDGYEVTKILKSDIRTSHIPIILLTAKSSLDSKLVGLEMGADDYIVKPFYTEEIMIRIEKLIQLRSILHSKYNQIPTNERLNIAENGIVKPIEAVADAQIISKIDSIFLEKLKEIIEANLDNDELDVAYFTDALALSRSQLHRKMVALTNQSISEFIRNYRLDKAKEILQQKLQNVNEVAYMVGFKDAKYFSTAFKRRFSVSPSEI